MARGGGGGRRRTYTRDANGRFSSTPGGGGGLGGSRKSKSPGAMRKAAGTLQARSSLKASRAKAQSKDKADPTLRNTLSTRAQKGAVTRASKKLATAKTESRTRLKVAQMPGTLSKSASKISKSNATKASGPSMTADEAMSLRRVQAMGRLRDRSGSTIRDLAAARKTLVAAQKLATRAENPKSKLTPAQRKGAMQALAKAKAAEEKKTKSYNTLNAATRSLGKRESVYQTGAMNEVRRSMGKGPIEKNKKKKAGIGSMIKKRVLNPIARQILKRVG